MTNEMTIYKGDNKSWQVTVEDQDDVAVDVTSAEVVFTVRTALGDSTAQIERKNVAAGGSVDEIEMTDPTNGIFKIHIVPANTSSLTKGAYVYDIQVTVSSKVYTIIRSTFTISEDVTK